MTSYQDCHRHLGYLTRETDIARKLLEKHGKASAQAVKELRNETDMPMGECADMLRCLWRDMELERLLAENARLRELLASTISNYVDGYMDGASARYLCDLCDESSMQQCDYQHDGQCPFYSQLREL